jgi:hypothetical protein
VTTLTKVKLKLTLLVTVTLNYLSDSLWALRRLYDLCTLNLTLLFSPA